MPYPDVALRNGSNSRTLAWADVYWFDFGAPASNQYTIAGPRPCVIVSNLATLVGRTVVVCPSTGAEHAVPGYDYHVLVKKAEFAPLDKDSVFKADHLYNVGQTALIDEHYMGTLSQPLMKRLYSQLLNALNVPAFIKQVKRS